MTSQAAEPRLPAPPSPGLREAFLMASRSWSAGLREFMAKLGLAGTAAGRGASTCDCWLGGVGAGWAGVGAGCAGAGAGAGGLAGSWHPMFLVDDRRFDGNRLQSHLGRQFRRIDIGKSLFRSMVLFRSTTTGTLKIYFGTRVSAAISAR